MFYPGQRVIASDGAQYVLVGHFEGSWWGCAHSAPRTPGGAMPRPISPLYPAWGGDDERAGADQAGAIRPRERGATQRGAMKARGAATR